MRTEDAVEIFGNKIALAEAIGISASAVYQWGSEIPMSRRQSVRMAIKERAEQLEQEAADLRVKAANS